MPESKIFRCPNCSGVIRYDISESCVVCRHCGSEFSPSELSCFQGSGEYIVENAEREHAVEPNDFLERAPWDVESNQNTELAFHTCTACGAKVITDVTTASAGCPYCGNNMLLASVITDENLPQKIVPFEIERDEAQYFLQGFLLDKKYLPSGFDALVEHVVPMYVPYRMFEVSVSGSARCVYNGSSGFIPIWISGDDYFEYTVDASSKMPDTLMDSVGPFDLSKAVPFLSSHAAGMCLEVADEGDEEIQTRLIETVMRLFKTHMQKAAIDEGHIIDGGFQKCDVVSMFAKARIGKDIFCLLPVWVWHCTYNDEDFLFAVNGQTGKVVGNLPVSSRKRVKTWIMPIASVVVSSCICAMMILFISASGAFSNLDILWEIWLSVSLFALIAGFTKAALLDIGYKNDMKAAQTHLEKRFNNISESRFQVEGFRKGVQTIMSSIAADQLGMTVEEMNSGIEEWKDL